MLEEKLDESKGDGEASVRIRWKEEKQKLEEELEEERGRIKKISEELAWERERKDAFDKRLEGIENRGESERNRTLEAEKRQLELKIKDLEGSITEKESEVKRLSEEVASVKQQFEEELAREKEQWDARSNEQANKFKEEKEKSDNALAAQIEGTY